MGGLLSATGETRLLMKMSVLSLVLGIPTAFLMVPSLGIIGMIIGLPIAAFPSTFIGLYFIFGSIMVPKPTLVLRQKSFSHLLLPQ